MAVTIVDHRIVVNEADAITNWTGTVTLFTADPAPIEATGEVGATVGVAIFDSYVAYSDDLSDAVIYCWVFSRLALGNTTDANGGLMVSVGEATNLGAWKVAGADLAAFRHDAGPTGWQCPALDTTSLPASPLSRAGSAASVNFSAVTRVGTTVNSLVAAPGMNPTYLVDIIRVLDITDTAFNNCAISVIGGTSGDPGTFAEIAAADRSTATLAAHGLVRQLATGAFGCQGPLRFGDGVGTTSSWFEDVNATLVFESRGFRTTLYKIFITDNGTGTATFILTNCALIAPTGVGASFDSLTDTDVTAVTVTGRRIDGFTGGIGVGGGARQVFTTCTFSNGGAVSVTSQSVDFTGSSVTGSTVAANTSALIWNVDTDTDGLLDNMTFSKGTNAHHAIEFGTALTLPKSITLRGIDFTGFSATEGGTTGDETFHIKDTTGTLTINLIGCTGNVGYRTDGASVSIVQNPVTTLINIKDFDGNNEAGVAVYLEGTFVDSGSHTGGNDAADLTDSGQSWGNLVGQKVVNMTDGSAGTISANTATTITATLAEGTDNNWDTNDTYIINADLPVDEPVSISRGVTTTATVTHTAHGMNTGEYIKFSGITDDEDDNSGAFPITVIDADSYSYTSNNSGTLTYTGDIRATGATIYGTTDDPNGNISSSRTYSRNQPLTGYARKSDDGVTYFKAIDLDDTVNSSTGLTINRRLVED